MKRVGLALALAFVVGLMLRPGAAGAGDAFHNGLKVGVRSGPTDVGHERNSGPHEFNHHLGFIHRRTNQPFGSTVIVVPVPRWLWVPGFWWWNGFDWVWVPGRWTFAGHTLFLRNPCD